MGAPIGNDVMRSREDLFTRIALAFAHHDFDAVADGVRPDVELTLRGSSWLAGKYRGYEEFGHYVAGAAEVLAPAGRQLSYLHDGNEMTVIHDFLVGGGELVVEMPLHVVVAFDTDEMIESLLIRPWDQSRFDEAVNAFLVPSR
jgi:hypothetical protein